MRKLYENFHIIHFQKRIVSAETIRENTVLGFQKIISDRSLDAQTEISCVHNLYVGKLSSFADGGY